MKIGHFAVLPPAVRYDRALADKSILLWGEISASADQYGVCTDDNKSFASALNVDVRTIARLINQLVDNGHLVRIITGNKRKLRVILKGITPPHEEEILTKEPENIIEFTTKAVARWESVLGLKVESKEALHHKVRICLELFTETELLTALNKRIHYILSVDMLAHGANPSIEDSFIPEKVTKWLKS